jgi:hypothetical protein
MLGSFGNKWGARVWFGRTGVEYLPLAVESAPVSRIVVVYLRGELGIILAKEMSANRAVK